MSEDDSYPFWAEEDDDYDYETSNEGPCVNCGRDTVCADYSFEYDMGQKPIGHPLCCMACGARWGGWADGAVYVPGVEVSTAH